MKPMTAPQRHLWPFEPRLALFAMPVLLLVLLLVFGLLRAVTGWPGAGADSSVVIAILVFSALPIVLVLADLLIEHGALLGIKGFTIDLSRLSAGPDSVHVATNIGVPEKAVNDSSSAEILGTLQDAINHAVVVVDLRDGNSWWETRLLVLAAGAARRQQPGAIVFTGLEGGVRGKFQGWAEPAAICRCLLAANPAYRPIYEAAEAAENKWSLVEPVPPGRPNMPPWFDGLANQRFYWAFDDQGNKNALRFERLLASELGERIEQQIGPAPISLVRLDDLLRLVLHKQVIDESSTSRQQLEEFFRDDAPYIAVTKNDVYLRLLSRTAALRSILKSLTVDPRGNRK